MAVCLLLMLSARSAQGQPIDYVWIGDDSNCDWSNPDNWHCTLVPGSVPGGILLGCLSRVTIPTGGEVCLDMCANVDVVEIEGGATLTVLGGSTLGIGTLNGAGTLLNEGVVEKACITTLLENAVLDISGNIQLQDVSGAVWSIDDHVTFRFNNDYETLSGDFRFISSSSKINIAANSIATTGDSTFGGTICQHVMRAPAGQFDSCNADCH